MNIIQALILGVVEGITEFLPISSTAHMEIVSRLMGLAETDFVKTFQIAIQFGAILAVIFIYFETLKKNFEIWKRILVAFVPTGVVGFVLYKLIKNQLLGNMRAVVLALGLGGIILILCEYILVDNKTGDSTRELEIMPYATAFWIGLAQALAVIPGVSRSAATIVAGRSLGVSKKAVVEFSFLLAVPTMLAASGYDLLKSAGSFSASYFGLIAVGFICAFFAALFSVRALLAFVKNHDFKIFGFYRILAALFTAFLFW